jgi:hypothetical protein
LARLGRLRREVVLVEDCSATRLEFFNDSDICIYQHHGAGFYSVHPGDSSGLFSLRPNMRPAKGLTSAALLVVLLAARRPR